MSEKKIVLVAADAPQEIIDELGAKYGERYRFVTSGELREEEAPPAEVSAAEVLVMERPHRGILSAAINCKWLHVLHAGVDKFTTLDIIKQNKQLFLTNSATVYDIPLSEHAMAMILTLTRKINLALEDQRRTKWNKPRNDLSEVLELSGKTIGILGLGRIGLEIAKRSKAFGMNVMGVRKNAKAPLREGYAQYVDSVYPTERIEEVLSASDIVVNCLPLTSETLHVFNSSLFSKFKKNSIFVNVGRGKSVVEKDLVEALNAGWLRYAALDVFDTEPLPKDSPFWGMKNVLVSGHYGGDSEFSVRRSYRLFVQNFQRYSKGEPLMNVVDKNLGY